MKNDTGSRPAVLAAADAASGGKVSERITDLARGRATYPQIVDMLRTDFGVTVSREMVRRWVVAEGLTYTPERTEVAK